jgi:hypothetical protein
MMREDHILPKSHVFLAIQFCLLLGFIISITCIHLSWLNVNEIILFGLCATAVFFIYIIKRLSIIFIKWLTDGDYTLSEYYYRVFAINRLLGIILFPMVLLLAVSDKELATAYLTCCWVIVGIGILWRVVSGALAAFQSGVSILYIFFYICTLELFPILAGYKTILYLGTGVFHFN